MNESEIQWGSPSAVWWLMAVVLIAGVLIHARVRRRVAWRQMAGVMMPGMFSSRSRLVRVGMVSCLLGCAMLLVLALLDLRWGKAWQEVPQRGIEAVFVLDVSRSMLAEDVSPNRLERAKQQIKDMVDEMPGDRVGLVVFAGESRQTIPLTRHVEDFKQTLDSVGTHSVRRGGSRLGDAIRVASDAFLDKTTDHKAMVIFTDGEDQESEPVQVAERVHKELGIRIFAIGLGDMASGARIPDVDPDLPGRRTGRYVKYKGEPVVSKMNGEILQAVATTSDGTYIPAGTKRVDMAEVVHGYIANVDDTELQIAKINAYVPRFHWFAIPALVLLIAEVFWSGWRGRAVARAAASFFGLAFFVGLASNVLAADSMVAEFVDANARRQYNAAVEGMASEEAGLAGDVFEQLAGSRDTAIAMRSRYNAGHLRYAETLATLQSNPDTSRASLDEAIRWFRSTLRLAATSDGDELVLQNARRNLELALRLRQQLEEQEQQDEQQENGQSEQDEDDSNREPEKEEPDDSESADDTSERSEDQSASGDESEAEPSGGEQQQPSSEQQESESDPSSSEQNGGESKSSQDADQSEEPGENSAEGSDEQGSEGELEANQPAGPSTSEGDESNEEPKGEPNDEGRAMATRLMTPEEAQKMLQAVRDRDMLRRYSKEQRERSRQIPVDRDW